ncbi:ankyrin repeat-containing protein BDA1-like [Cornus florida]|uniref:ankyrin repeat-containing protein BDA1-like n=1 Tax=Cornus florida TaxID=4283 RepID=UPI0028A270E3|nr:ankyrin repeat-containing protein BDA1-like [Cornus florida]
MSMEDAAEQQRLITEATAIARARAINGLYALFRKSPNVLEIIDEIPFVDTPLHIAASIGDTHFAAEMISLMPSFGTKLNPDGLSPLHLALQNRHAETVTRLININSELIRVQGRERITPLHYVAEMNEFHLLAEFLCACPDSVNDLTIRGETAVHIAVRNCNVEAFEVLFEWADKTDRGLMLHWKDEGGNTALHIAVYTHQPEVVEKLVRVMKIKNDKNLEGWTPLDLSRRRDGGNRSEITKMLMGGVGVARSCSTTTTPWNPYSTSDGDLTEFICLKRIPDLFNMKKMSEDMKNTMLLVATLVATATYQVAVKPPSGIFDKDESGRKTLLVSEFLYYSLLFINSTAFAISVAVISLTLQLGFHFRLLRLCLWFLVFSYIISVLFTTPKTVASYITVPLPFISYLGGTYNFFSVIYTFAKMPIGRYNPSVYFEMRRKMVGWDASC